MGAATGFVLAGCCLAVLARAFVAFEPGFVLRAAAGQLAYVVAFTVLVALVWRRAQRRLVVHGG